MALNVTSIKATVDIELQNLSLFWQSMIYTS